MSSRTKNREHHMKLVACKFKISKKKWFLTKQVVQLWNLLQKDFANIRSIHGFKLRLYKLIKEKSIQDCKKKNQKTEKPHISWVVYKLKIGRTSESAESHMLPLFLYSSQASACDHQRKQDNRIAIAMKYFWKTPSKKCC